MTTYAKRREDWYHYQFYVQSDHSMLIAVGVPVIRRGQMTVDEVKAIAENVRNALAPNDPFRAVPMYFTECVVEVRGVDARLVE